MKIPQFQQSVVTKAKVLGYLLSPTHPDGCGKALWFARFGFNAENWRVLAEALRQHGQRQEIESIEDSPFGKRYTKVGPLASPDGRDPTIRSVWFVKPGSSIPRLVTAYPTWRKR